MPESEVGPTSWYALYTKHQHEKKASTYLGKTGFEVLLPTYQSASRRKDRNKIITLPIFPGYVFVRAGLDRTLDLLKAPGVFWIVGNSNGPIMVPETEIDGLKKIMRSDARVEPHPYLKTGDRVRVRSGSLSGLEGILVRFKNVCRVVLSLELLQKALAVEIDASLVERIGPAMGAGRAVADSQQSI